MKFSVVKKIVEMLTLVVILGGGSSILAEQGRSINNSSLSIPKGLEGRVNFWRLVFTRYGKFHRVFHDRSHPEVIFSVLDFSEYEEKLSGHELLRAKEQEILKEEEHIRRALNNLAEGNSPQGAFEERIDRLYRQIPTFSRRMFRDALEADQIRYQTGIMERFREGVSRSGRYLRAIEHVFVEEGLPPELGRVPLVESSFDYTAYSSVGAAGIWQFMPATARRFMKVTPTIDERKDPIIATRAAASYLKNAYEDTGHWSLAVTSYNHGLSGILKATREVGTNNIVEIINKYQSKSFGFASSNFYAEFLAALDVERNSERYFPGLIREPALEFDEVVLPKAISFSTLCSYSGASRNEIQELNLGFLDKVLEDRVSIPAGTQVKIPLKNYQQLASRVPSTMLVSRSSDYKAHLYAVNNLDSGDEPSDLPRSVVKKVDEEMIASSRSGEGTEVVILGEEIGGRSSSHSAYQRNAIVVRREGGKLKKVARGVKSRNDTKSILDKKTTLGKSSSAVYSIKKGDSLSSIAKKFKVNIAELKKANSLSSDGNLKAGKNIKIPKP